MAQKKATKKFEKRHLKDTLERRNGLKKIKQKQQLKAQRKARRAEENGHDVSKDGTKAPENNGRQKPSDDAFKNMSVDEFFQGGFEVPELPKSKSTKSANGKRKRTDADDDDDSAASDEDSNGSLAQEPVPNGSDAESDSEDDLDDFKQQLDELATKDPAFHRMLKQDEPDIFDDLDALELSEDDENTPKRKKQKKSSNDESDDDDEGEAGKNELDLATVKKWRSAMQEQFSLRAAKEVVTAFRSAAQSTAEAEDKAFKYSVSDPEVYHLLLTTALTQIPVVFQHHLPAQEGKNGKVHVQTEAKKFKTIAPLLRAQISGILHLLEHLSDPKTLRLTLTSTLPLIPYLLSFKKLVREVVKAVSEAWSASSNTESTRIAAFLVMRRLVVIGDAGIRENVLKAAYQALVRSSRNTTVHTVAGVNLMKNSASELWGLAAAEGSVAYTTAFTFIRSLAIHLRSSITNNSNESYKTVYNWQYVHSLDFWSRVLAAHGSEPTSTMRQLIYPLVQVTIGALRLIPTATYFPLRFQLVRSLLRISLATSTYIPVAATLYEVLASAEMRKAPKPGTLKPLDFGVSIRAPKSYLRTRVYQDGVGEQTAELLSEFFVIYAKSIAFPELALPIVVMLKRWLKDVSRREPKLGNKNQKINEMIRLLVQKLEANSRWIEERRAKVDFAPNDRRGVEAFLKETEWQSTPLGAYVVGQRKSREERAKVIEEGRKADEARQKRERSSRQTAEEIEDDESEEDELEEEEYHNGFEEGDEMEEDSE